MLEVAAGWAAPNKLEAGACVVGAAVLAVVAEGVPSLNKLGVELGAVVLVPGAALAFEAPDRDGNKEEVGAGIDVA